MNIIWESYNHNIHFFLFRSVQSWKGGCYILVHRAVHFDSHFIDIQAHIPHFSLWTSWQISFRLWLGSTPGSQTCQLIYWIRDILLTLTSHHPAAQPAACSLAAVSCFCTSTILRPQTEMTYDWQVVNTYTFFPLIDQWKTTVDIAEWASSRLAKDSHLLASLCSVSCAPTSDYSKQ